MDDRCREHIQKNLNELVRSTSFQELINECERTHLISGVMRKRIENLSNADEEEKHKELFLKITRRGPTAYDDLIQILVSLKFDKAARILRAPKQDASSYISIHDQAVINKSPKGDNRMLSVPEGCYPSKDKFDPELDLTPFTGEIRLLKYFEVKKSKVIHIHRLLKVYPMKSKNRGVFFMVNIIDFPKSGKKQRSGADEDGMCLLHLFKEFGFTCFEYVNLTGSEFFEILGKLRSSEYLRQTESFVMALMSHGEMCDEDMHDRVEFHDGSVVKVKEIEDFLANDQCFNLINKPKVLLFPFCRGRVPDKGVETDGASFNSRPNQNVVPTLSDMIVCYATVRGFQSLRDPDKGSWYIQAFCRVLAEHAHDTDLQTMLVLVDNAIKPLRSAETGYMQTPSAKTYGFSKALFFNPGISEE